MRWFFFATFLALLLSLYLSPPSPLSSSRTKICPYFELTTYFVHCSRSSKKRNVNEGKKTQDAHSIRTVILNHSRLHFIRAFMKNVDTFNCSWSAWNRATKNHWINHAGHFEWAILPYVLWQEEQIKEKKRQTHAFVSHYPLSVEFLDDTLLFAGCYCCCCFFIFAFAAADEFQIRRHIVFVVVASRRIQFFVSRDCIFVDLLKP